MIGVTVISVAVMVVSAAYVDADVQEMPLMVFLVTVAAVGFATAQANTANYECVKVT